MASSSLCSYHIFNRRPSKAPSSDLGFFYLRQAGLVRGEWGGDFSWRTFDFGFDMNKNPTSQKKNEKETFSWRTLDLSGTGYGEGIVNPRPGVPRLFFVFSFV